MQNNRWWLLQLFADGGDGSAAGGDGVAAAATGENGADAGHKRLLELGVPADKIRKNRSYGVSAPAKSPATAEQAVEQTQNPEQDDAAQKPTEEVPVTKRMTWEEVKADPEYSKEMQNMVQQRLKKSKAAEEAMNKLTPALEILARVYGMDPAKLDYDALAEKVNTDDRFYEERGLELGVDPSVARKLDQFDLMQERQRQQKEQQKQSAQDQALQEHYANLVRQGDELKEKFPGFDLQEELKNPVFARMTAPGVGLMSVEDAYRAVHRKEIEQAAVKATAQRTAENISNAIRSGTMRPAENGAAPSSPSVSTFSYKNASQEERNALKQRIRLAAARGEKVYPGQ